MLKKFSVAIAVKAVLAFILIQYAGIGLAPDEAQYWTWSQNVDWAYYSKPPGIAWQVFLGTQLFGNTELGVRFFSIIISVALAFAMYYMAKQCSLHSRAAFWAGAVMALCPVGILSSFAATTDGGFILFWILACSFFVGALDKEVLPNYLLIGACVAIGAFFKWPIYMLWIFFLAFAWYYPKLRSKSIAWGFAISLLGLFPSMLWNMQNEWATFKHVWFSVVQPSAGALKERALFNGNTIEFFSAQLGVFSPILFVMLLVAFVNTARGKHVLSLPFKFCFFVTASLLSFSFVLSLFNRLQANWGVFIYPTAVIIMVWYCFGTVSRARWLRYGTILSVLLSSFIIALPAIQERQLPIGFTVPYKGNIFRHSLGWNVLKVGIEKYGYSAQENFLFSDKYQMSSILSFYSPDQKRAYFLNIHNRRKNQFSFWPEMSSEQKGKTGYFVIAENAPHYPRGMDFWEKDYLNRLQPYFERVEYLGELALFHANGEPVKGAMVFKCHGYNGIKPNESVLY